MKRITRYAAGALCISFALAGCSRDRQEVGRQDASSSGPSAPATGTTSLQASPTQPILTRTDQDFVARAAGDNGFQIAIARLALEQSQTPQVREMAQRVIKDHTRMNNELADIARRRGTAHPSTPVPVKRAEQLRSDLGRLSGDAFTKAFAGVLVNDHHDAIALFSKEADSGEDSDLRAFARKELPTLQAHLAMAEALNKQPSPAGAASH